jgi:iron-sulfur cluster repair protein YtfE (RIC family)
MDENKIDNKVSALVPELKEYVQALMIEKGNDIMPADIQAEMMHDLYTRFGDYLMVNLSKSMEKEASYQFEDMLSNQDPSEEVINFIKEKTDFEKVVKETCDEFREIYIGKK